MSAVPAEIIERIVDVRERQQQAIARLGIPSAPSVSRLREEAEVAAGFKELFADLGLVQPMARGDGNSVASRIDHLRELQPLCKQWRKAQLGPIAASDAGAFENIAADIVRAATAVAADRTVGSLRDPERMRPVTRVDATGVTVTRWHGKPTQWMTRFMPPAYTVVSAFGNGRGDWYP
jgi:hypothetical protein